MPKYRSFSARGRGHLLDNIPEGTMHRPPLTTAAVGAREVGEEAARLLLRGIKSPKGPPESTILPPKLVFHSSCGARPAI
jgi:LacI family transcriptional regulator